MLAKITGTLIVALTLLGAAENGHARPAPRKCPEKSDDPVLTNPVPKQDLLVVGKCIVPEGDYTFGDVNIIEGPNGVKGELLFMDATINFYAKSILIENKGALIAGWDDVDKKIVPIGTKPGSVLTIHLYGADGGLNGVGIDCVQENCGIPSTVWCSQPKSVPTDPHEEHYDCTYPATHEKVPLPNASADWFYRYHPLTYDGGENEQSKMVGYFGYKVLAVSYGGTLQLFGKHGAIDDGLDPSKINPADSGNSWRRIDATIRKGTREIKLAKPTDWVKKTDSIVVTSTDYLPGHSEERIIDDISADGLQASTVETRAAVALLTRSIRIVSDGAEPGSPFTGFIGGHTIVRQGVAKFQVQGVEFKELGQGGRIGHYPVHFHMARKVPTDTFVKDNSVNDSMTRWVVLHGTHNVTLARNVGWKSIGHGYYLEEGTEIDNKLYSNIGIFARAALVDAKFNPRNVPGILAAERIIDFKDPNAYKMENVPFYSDYDHPSVFWIMNAWNKFENNLAVGAGACGVCYWMLPGAVSGHSREQKWEGYAALQMGAELEATTRAGLTPVQSFVGNGCSSAGMSFNTTGNTSACIGVGKDKEAGAITLAAVPNPLAPPPCDQSDPRQPKPNEDKYEPYSCNQPAYKASLDYYPQVGGGGRFPTRCDANDTACESVKPCGGDNLDRCMVTVIDKYTTSFNFTEQNFAAIWLRPQWYLLSNSAITDVVNAGLTFVTGGGYTASDVVRGHWALAYKSVFIGQTQDPANPNDAATPFTSNASPFNDQPGALKCENGVGAGNRCVNRDEGVAFPRSNFGVGQRLFNIYDGPAYQADNAYLNITEAKLDCTPGKENQSISNCAGTNKFLVSNINGVPRRGQLCYMPNAAIGWKQPNGFYYPPAFHSNNLYFDHVDIRHYVVQPLFNKGTYVTNKDEAWADYCNWTVNMFDNWTDIDRQTELNDDDGSLTGYKDTISVNEDPFFNAPEEGIECLSDETAKTSPYDYVTSVIYPGCATGDACPDVPLKSGGFIKSWNKDCSNEKCSGIPMYRQYDPTPPGPHSAIRMAGQATYQRSTLAVNNGLAYIDTTVGIEAQRAGPPLRDLLNVFLPDGVYYSFVLFAKPTTRQTYQIYVGKPDEDGTNGFDEAKDIWPVRADIRTTPPTYTLDNLKVPTHWAKKYDKKTGILEVTMDMTEDKTFADEYQLGLNDGCKPSSFCTLSGNTCGCAAGAIGCTAAVCKWAGKDTACPDKGCWGFGFRLTKNFDTIPKPAAPPDMECYPPDAAAGWYVDWKDPTIPKESNNTCYKPTVKKPPATPPIYCKKS